MKDDEILNPVQGDGRFAGSLPFFGGLKIWEANPQIVDEAARSAARCSTPRSSRTATCTAGATRRRSSIARRRSGSPAWTTCPAIERHEARATRCARPRSRGIEATQFYPGVGQGAAARHDRATGPTGRCRASGSGACRCRSSSHKETGELHPRHARRCSSRPRERVEQGGIEAWQTLDARGLSASTRANYAQDHRHARRLVRLGLDASDGAGRPGRRTAAHGSHRSDTGFPADLYLEGSDQHRGWFHSSLLDRRAC